MRTLVPWSLFAVLAHGAVFAQSQPAAPGARNANGYRALQVARPLSPPLGTFAALVGGSDACATPDVLTGTGLFAFDTTAATTGAQGQGNALCNLTGAGTAILRDVWFTWTAPVSGIGRVNTCGTTGVDTKIAIYAGAGCPTGAAIACNDDACVGFQSTVTWSATAGQQYTIQIGLYPGANPPAVPGAGQFELVVFTAPANDECSAPTVISGLGSFAFDNIAATTGTQGQAEAPCNLAGAGTAILQDVWYVWTAPLTGNVRISTCTSSVDTKLALYQGAGCPGAILACSDDVCGPTGWQSSITLSVSAGQQYTLQLGLYPGTAPVATPGLGTFQIADASPPANDECLTPSAIAGPGPHAYDSTFATTGAQGQAELACDFFGSTTIQNDQWFVWTSSVTGSATLTTCGGFGFGSSEDTKVAVYAGAGCPTGPALACNDDDGVCGILGFPSTITWPVVCGQRYTVQLGRYPFNVNATQGTFSITETGATCVAGVAVCLGDGTGAVCPCNNFGNGGNGCANSVVPGGSNLTGSGSASLSADALTLLGSGMPNSSCLYFQGSSQLGGGLGVVFGDGLRCAGGTIVRLGTRSNVAGASQYPVAGDPPVSVRGLITSAGSVRTYQVWYRNAASFCTPATFNLSNGFEVTWQP
ncbi:MAG: hypothetical protein JNK02_14650 [Planctomycetes bacterium]|nr:hypothetical protein [Planctomycetota bacterium]